MPLTYPPAAAPVVAGAGYDAGAINAITTGRYYLPGIGHLKNTGVTVAAFTTGVAMFTPMVLGSPHVVADLSVQTGGGGSTSSVSLGIYGSDASGLPSSLLSSNTTSVSGSGFQVITVTMPPGALPAGLYWLAFLVRTGSQPFRGITYSASPYVGDTSAGVTESGMFTSSASNLPSTVGTLTVPAAGASVPLVFARFSS